MREARSYPERSKVTWGTPSRTFRSLPQGRDRADEATSTALCSRLMSSRFLLVPAIMVQLDSFDRGNTSAQELAEDGEKGIHLVFGVENFNDDWQVMGGAQDFCGVKPASLAISHIPLKDGCAREVRGLSLDHDLFIERAAFILVVLAAKNA